MGVYYDHKRERWRGELTFKGKRHASKCFSDRSQAEEWVNNTKRELWADHLGWAIHPEVPVRTLLKREIDWLRYHYCQHGFSYLAHYDCYLKERPDTSPLEERIGFLDIETGNLHADFGYIFSYGIRPRGTKKIFGRALTSREIRSYVFDRELMKEFCRDVRKFDRVIVHWGKDRRHDLPFLRTRVLKHQREAKTPEVKAALQFPFYKDVFLQDTFDMAKNKLRLASNRLENICRFFGIPAKAHKLDPNKWQKALAGSPKDLRHIWLHNKEDVISLEEVYELLHAYVPKSKTSI